MEPYARILEEQRSLLNHPSYNIILYDTILYVPCRLGDIVGPSRGRIADESPLGQELCRPGSSGAYWKVEVLLFEDPIRLQSCTPAFPREPQGFVPWESKLSVRPV